MNPTILIIDRSEHFCELIRIRLLNYGYDRCRLAQSSKEGLALFTRHHPRIVLLETNMDDVRGTVLCRRMKQLRGEQVKVILMSGLAEPNQAKEAEAAGADDYALKAFDCEDLTIVIKRQIAEAEQIA